MSSKNCVRPWWIQNESSSSFRQALSGMTFMAALLRRSLLAVMYSEIGSWTRLTKKFIARHKNRSLSAGTGFAWKNPPCYRRFQKKPSSDLHWEDAATPYSLVRYNKRRTKPILCRLGDHSSLVDRAANMNGQVAVGELPGGWSSTALKSQSIKRPLQSPSFSAWKAISVISEMLLCKWHLRWMARCPQLPSSILYAK